MTQALQFPLLACYKDDIDLDQFQKQLPLCVDMIQQALATCCETGYICAYHMWSNEHPRCLQVNALWNTKLYLTVPITSVTAERSFSTMKRVLCTHSRSSMTEQRIYNCMLLHIHKELTVWKGHSHIWMQVGLFLRAWFGPNPFYISLLSSHDRSPVLLWHLQHFSVGRNFILYSCWICVALALSDCMRHLSICCPLAIFCFTAFAHVAVIGSCGCMATFGWYFFNHWWTVKLDMPFPELSWAHLNSLTILTCAFSSLFFFHPSWEFLSFWISVENRTWHNGSPLPAHLVCNCCQRTSRNSLRLQLLLC